MGGGGQMRGQVLRDDLGIHLKWGMPIIRLSPKLIAWEPDESESSLHVLEIAGRLCCRNQAMFLLR